MSPAADPALGPPRIEEVGPRRWREAVGGALAAGARAVDLHAAGIASEPLVRVTLVEPDASERVLAARASGGALDSVADLVPALDWDEREACDLAGVCFGGRPRRALAAHPAAPEEWMTPVRGADVHEVAVGPIHAGVIESGHFRFHVVGERVLHVDLRLFYTHRGLERAAAGLPLRAGLAYAQRACAACAVANAVAYAHACEQAVGLRPDERLRRARTLLLELERLYNHLNDIGAVCSGIGFAPGAMAFAALKERAQRLNASLTGHRFLFRTVDVGAGLVVVDAEAARRARAEVEEIGVEAARAWREIRDNTSVRDRLAACGTLDAAAAGRLGSVGPAARAAGIARDARAGSARLWYPGLAPARPDGASGDAAARVEVRALEIGQSVELLADLLGGAVPPGRCRAGGAGAPLGVGRVESPRGETVCVVERRGGRLVRLRLRTSSYANWPAVAHAATGAILPDFPVINKSFELCYACADR